MLPDDLNGARRATELLIEGRDGRAEVGVPKDLAIVGVDDPEWVPLVDRLLTTVAQPGRQMALDAMELLLERVVGRRQASRRIVHPMR